MATTKGKVSVSCEMPKELVAQIDERKNAEGRSRSEVIIRAVMFYLAHAEVEPVAEPSVPKIRKKSDK